MNIAEKWLEKSIVKQVDKKWYHRIDIEWESLKRNGKLGGHEFKNINL